MCHTEVSISYALASMIQAWQEPHSNLAIAWDLSPENKSSVSEHLYVRVKQV